MNDITALPPVTPEMLASLKLSASNLAEGEMMSFEPAVFRALVEALEKARRANTAQDDHINQQQDRIDILEKRNAELGKHVGMLEKRLRGTEESLIASVDMVRELESRTVTVKLPVEKFCPAEYAGSQLWSETEVWNKAITACADALRAAGIQVIEGEGQ